MRPASDKTPKTAQNEARFSPVGTDHDMPDSKPEKRAATLTRYMSREDVPFDDANTLLLEHAHLMHGRMVKAGGPDFDIQPHLESFWSKFDQVLPPWGELLSGMVE